MSYPSYLIHFNKNHSSSTGQFISGDGDGDGIVNDHKNQTNAKESAEKVKSLGKKQISAGAATAAAGAATIFVSHIVEKSFDSGALNVAAKVGKYAIGPAVLGTGLGTMTGGAINTAVGTSALKKG